MKHIGLIIIGAIIVVLAGFYITTYNTIIKLEEEVDTEYSNISVQLERRADLIPNLVNTVKGYMAHVIVENYPDLKANENFITLQDELAGTENRISTARRDYNDAVKAYNTKIKTIPASFIASMMGKEKKDYFEVSDKSKENVPEVNFD